MNKQFVVNKKYSVRSLCDYDCIFSFKVVRRTKKSIWITEKGSDTPVRRSIFIYCHEECLGAILRMAAAVGLKAN